MTIVAMYRVLLWHGPDCCLQTQALSVFQGQFFGTDGGPITLKGVNWFGFETSNTMMDGLWQGPTALTQDFGTVAYRIQLLGFNAIRLPFSFQVTLQTSVCERRQDFKPGSTWQRGRDNLAAGPA
jgi:hypothetical protein